MRGILEVMDERIAAGGVVYVHCWGGRGRTGTATGCWLARHRVAAGDEVIAILQQLRRPARALESPIPAARAQRDLVVRWRPWE